MRHIQKLYGVKTRPFTMKDQSCNTLHSPNHNGGGAKLDFRVLSIIKTSIPAKKVGYITKSRSPDPMSFIQNQKGVTLVVVLLMITVFSILGLSVLGFAITNTKQIEHSETDMQAVDLAEMGVTKYKYEVVDDLTGQINDQLDDEFLLYLSMKYKDELNQLYRNDKNSVIPQIEKYLREEIMNFSFTTVPTETPYIITKELAKPTRYFEIKAEKPSPVENHKIKVAFTSDGNIHDTSNTIESTISLNLGTLTFNILLNEDGSIDNGSSVGNGKIPANLDGIIKRPTVLQEDCLFTNTFKNHCSYQNVNGSGINGPSDIEAVIKNNLTLGSVNGGIKDSTLYIEQNSAFNSINGGIKSSNIYTGRNATFGNINSGITKKSTIVVKGTATFSEPVDITESDLYFGTSVHVQKAIKLDESNLFIQGTANMNGNFDQLIKSTIHIGGSATFNGAHFKQFNNSSINIGGAATFTNLNFDHQIANSVIYIAGSASFHNVNFNSSPKFCIGGAVAFASPKANIYSPTIDPNAYKANCPLTPESNEGDTGNEWQIKEITINRKSLNESIDNQVDYY